MNTIYSRYNRSRLADFQTETSIIVDGGRKYVMKKALTKEACCHIERMYDSYCLQRENTINPILKLPKLLEKQESFMLLEYVEGVTFDQLLLESFLNDQVDKFWELVEQYYQFLTHSFQTVDKFSVTSETSIFFKDVNVEVIQSENSFIYHPNIDIILDNLLVSEVDDYYLIDNEWVFKGTLPWSFIFFRGMIIFYLVKHPELPIDKFASMEEIFERYKLSKKIRKEFEKMESNFQIYVNGSPSFTQIKHKFLKKKIPVFMEGEEFFSQRITEFFVDTGHGFNVGQSVVKPIIGKETQVEFDISEYHDIKRLRFDPLNVLTEVCIDQITVVDNNGVSFYITDYQTNALRHQENILLFDTDDPQICFDLHDIESPKKVIFSLEYLTIGSKTFNAVLAVKQEESRLKDQHAQNLEGIIQQNHLPTRYFAQLFVGIASGFSEEQSIIQDVKDDQQQLEFDISNYQSIKNLRFDPLNTMTALQIKQIVVVDEQGLNHEVDYQPVNTYAEMGEILLFDTDDPQILITLPNFGKFQKVVIQLHYVAMGTDTYRVLLKNQLQLIKQQNAQIRHLTQLVQQLRS